MIDLNTLCTFIPVSDTDSFAEYDNANGCMCCVYVEGGIVVSNGDLEVYSEIVADFEKWISE